MKRKMKKLTINKSTIVNLSNNELDHQRGGAPTDFCTIYNPQCNGTGIDCDMTMDIQACTIVCV